METLPPSYRPDLTNSLTFLEESGKVKVGKGSSKVYSKRSGPGKLPASGYDCLVQEVCNCSCGSYYSQQDIGVYGRGAGSCFFSWAGTVRADVSRCAIVGAVAVGATCVVLSGRIVIVGSHLGVVCTAGGNL